jgi:excisionase family DNA binding protein
MNVSKLGLVDAHGAAELLSVPASWLMREARAERIPHVRLGRYVRFKPDELEQWLQTRACGPRTGDRPTPKRRRAR